MDLLPDPGRAASTIDPRLIAGWLAARSIARGLPAPVFDRGGLRVDTGSASERSRYVFTAPCEGLAALGRTIRTPGTVLKLCDDDETLRRLLPDRWCLEPAAFVMTGPPASAGMPAGYRPVRDVDTALHLRIVAAAGETAASGHGAASRGVFAYDRIATHPAHRRRGLGRVVMATLGAAAPAGATHLLVATAQGRLLYESLGWRVVSAYATAFIPPAP